ncbi:hypothetical protein E4U17_001699 [Claviceps sp. LM77 group G4]|nr:hypothetical protein E4U17_001699 [Claviceps sp. LM77 group G4]KAG6074008.1 hypothetical protein E4U33_002682 [Claviceps sp. LM78 group G4]KAG6083126.1 hypothetical protein E4U16_004873 [Claviceps sp. LM84 group G4]
MSAIRPNVGLFEERSHVFLPNADDAGGMRKDDEHPIWTTKDYHNELLGRDYGSRRRIQLWKHAMAVRGTLVQSRRFAFHRATSNGGIGGPWARLSRPLQTPESRTPDSNCLQGLGTKLELKNDENHENYC